MYVAPVAPAIAVQPVVPSAERCHWYAYVLPVPFQVPRATLSW